jgi:hypothetical protein
VSHPFSFHIVLSVPSSYLSSVLEYGYMATAGRFFMRPDLFASCNNTFSKWWEGVKMACRRVPSSRLSLALLERVSGPQMAVKSTVVVPLNILEIHGFAEPLLHNLSRCMQLWLSAPP